MKRFAYLLSITVSVFAIAMVGMVGCEGPAGADGADGAAGEDGMDANETCIVCHNESSDLLAKQHQVANSRHMTGGHQERSEADCAACHTHEGFIDRMTSGEMAASGDVTDPTPPNCRSCHMVHENYDETDWELKFDDAVALWINSETVDFGDGNSCANCHQPRVPSPLPVVGGDSVTIGSPYWGPHYGVQSAMLWGTAGYEIAGSTAYPATPGSAKHAEIGCTSCHMAEVPEYGNVVGGHTFNMTFLDHGEATDNVAACSGCHTSIEDDFDYHDVVTETTTLFDSLKTLLINEGLVNAGSGRVNVGFGSPVKMSADDAGAVLNYLMVKGDHSNGIHNPAYTEALLLNTIEYLNQ